MELLHLSTSAEHFVTSLKECGTEHVKIKTNVTSVSTCFTNYYVFSPVVITKINIFNSFDGTAGFFTPNSFVLLNLLCWAITEKSVLKLIARSLVNFFGKSSLRQFREYLTVPCGSANFISVGIELLWALLHRDSKLIFIFCSKHLLILLVLEEVRNFFVCF